ncbi:MAG: FtsX-like permease family protein [Planctomycetota bacterium]|nr:FtsX-like permease family protein [Planctomycetota bacterium]
MTDLRLVIRSLLARPTSGIVTVLLIAIAVALLLSMQSLREAGRRSFTRGVGNAHLIVSAESSPLVTVLNGLFYANPPRAPLTQAKVSEIVDGFPWAMAIPTQLGDSFMGHPVVATTPDFLEVFEPAPGEPWRFAKGRNFEGPFEVVIGSRVARDTGLELGSRLHLTHGIGRSRETGSADPPNQTGSVGNPASGGHDHVHCDGEGHVHDEVVFEVVGILEPSGTHHDRVVIADLEGGWLVHAFDRRAAEGRPEPTSVADLEEADRLVTGLLLRTPVRAGRGSAAIVQQAFDRLRRDPAVTVASPSTQVDNLFGIVADLDAVFVALGFGILISGAFSVMLALWNSMELRRRQIAVLRVLGCTRARILGLVLTESAIIGLLGAATGVFLARFGGDLAAELLATRTGVVIQPELDVRASVIVAAATVVLAGVAGLAPAVKAYRTPVADNLRPLD